MDNAVREAFNKIWVDDEDIFTEQIPANVIVGLDEPTWATCQKLSISLRDYVPEGTQRGPDDYYILPARVILLQRP